MRAAAVGSGLIMAFALTVSSCGQSFTARDAGHAQRASSDWAAQFFGFPASMTHVVHGSEYLEGRWWAAERLPDPGQIALKSCAQVDVYAAPRTELAIVVFHAVPAWIDPARPYQPGAQPQWQLQGRAPSGARLYHWSRGGTLLIVLPSSTWIMVGDLVGDRLAAHVASDASDPPYLPALPGELHDYFTASRNAESRYWIYQKPEWVLGVERAVSGGTTLFPPRPDGMLPATLQIVFSDAQSAQAAATDIRRAVASGVLRAARRETQEGSAFVQSVTGADTDGATLIVNGVVTESEATSLLGRHFDVMRD